MDKQSEQKSPIHQAIDLTYGAGLNLETAKKMLEAGEREAEKQRVPMVIAIVDAGGNLLAFSRMDKAGLGSIQVAIDKAYTAVFGKMPSGEWGGIFQAGNLVPLFFHERWMTLPGGFPIRKDKVLLGGIGVSGGTIEDIYVAKAALEAGGFTLDDTVRALA